MNDDNTTLEFSAADDEASSGSPVQNPDPAKPTTFAQAYRQSPRRQAALKRAAEILKARQERDAPRVNFPAVSVKDSGEKLRKKRIQIGAAMAKMRQNHREIEQQRIQNRLNHGLNVANVNARIKNARNEVVGQIGQNKSTAVQQHAQKQKELNAQHKVRQSTVGWFDHPGAPLQKVGIFFGHLGRKLGVWGGHKATMGKYALMNTSLVRPILTSARKWQLRGQRHRMKRDFKTADRLTRDTVKAEKKAGGKLRRNALRQARAEHRAIKGDHKESMRPINRHKRARRMDWLKATGYQVKAFGHGVSAGIGHVAQKAIRTSKGPKPGM